MDNLLTMRQHYNARMMQSVPNMNHCSNMLGHGDELWSRSSRGRHVVSPEF